MGKEVTLGGDRLGSGNKNKQELHNYYRSTHNLSQKWTSSMGCGMLYPFLVLPAMRGDSFDINLSADARTIPTKAPLFGSFKMQVDLFQCPARLYQAILHNNPTAIGLKMNQVKFPLINPSTYTYQNDKKSGEFSQSCLLKYLGVSGIGTSAVIGSTSSTAGRYLNAIPLLAYYDIFKNYYSNKQEQNAWVVGGAQETKTIEITGTSIFSYNIYPYWWQPQVYKNASDMTDDTKKYEFKIYFDKEINLEEIEEYEISFCTNSSEETPGADKIALTLLELKDGFKNEFEIQLSDDKKSLYIIFKEGFYTAFQNDFFEYSYLKFKGYSKTSTSRKLTLNSFNLKNIDDMRMALLSHNNLGSAFVLGDSDLVEWNTTSGTDGSGLPYSINFDKYSDENSHNITKNKFPLNGLMLKTYQSDLYNNWVNTDWIDGDNGIAAITAISTSSGSFTMDALNLAEKLYNMLNRIAVSGNTYEDWQDAVYTQSPRRHIESPVYIGGMSSEIVFEEIVQTAPAEVDGEQSSLGTLGGRGIHVKRKGGHIICKVDEASFIIGIVSLTPRIVYSQGNEWYMTDLLSMDDFHKPALDGIGYEDLLGERLAWWNTIITAGGSSVVNRTKIGKVPAWINYMTAVDKAFGDFAVDDEKGSAFMTLNRRYEMGELAGTIQDATTYVDPQKYNYAFAYNSLDAQNFWVQIYSDIKARRLMSAKQIPNI